MVYNLTTGDKTGMMMDLNMATYQIEILDLALNAIIGNDFRFSASEDINLLHVSVCIFKSGYVR